MSFTCIYGEKRISFIRSLIESYAIWHGTNNTSIVPPGRSMWYIFWNACLFEQIR